jgi:hypothetical protein
MLKKRPSSGYDKPRHPDASDLRVATSVVHIDFRIVSIAKFVPTTRVPPRALMIFGRPPEVTELYAGRAEYFAWLHGCCSWPDKERLGFQSTDRKSRGTMNAIAFNFNTITISDGTVQFFQVARDVETLQQSRAQNHCLQHAAARKSQLINLV